MLVVYKDFLTNNKLKELKKDNIIIEFSFPKGASISKEILRKSDQPW